MNKQNFIYVETGLWTAMAVFLLSAFSHASYDITTWSADARAVCAILMGFLGTLAAFTHGIFDKR